MMIRNKPGIELGRILMRYSTLVTVSLAAMIAAGASIEANAQVKGAAKGADVDFAAGESGEEIVVTARKRSESLQEIPLSVAAISGAAFTQRGLTEFSDLSTVTSGLTFRKTSIGVVDFRIRGLGTGGGNDSFEQSVALFVDGISFSRSPEFSQPIFDIERAEVIKGTQASFLAKNTSLGAISITTRKPGNVWGFDATARYEFNLDSHLVSGGVDIPVTDNLSVRLSGQLSTDGGFIKNLASGVDLGERRAQAGRIVAAWQPVSDLDATIMYEEYTNRQIGVPVEVVIDNFGAARARAIAYGQLGNYETKLDYKTIASDDNIGESNDRTSGRFGSLTVNKKLGGYTLTSISSYAEYQKYFLFDNDYYIGSFVTTSPYSSSETQYTQELRISSPDNTQFNWIAGLFGMHETWRYHREVSSVNPPGFQSGELGSNSLLGALDQDMELRTKAVSGFALANFELVPDLTFTFGGRVTNENRRAKYETVVLTPGSYVNLYNAIPPTTLSFSNTLFDFSGGVQYQVNPSLMVYSSFSRGNKGGGYAHTPTNTLTARYGKEYADTVEGGFKYGRGRRYINAAMFHTKIHNFQQSIFNGGAFIFTQTDVISKGFEADGSYELTPGLVASGAVTYARARNPDDSTPVNAPKWSGNSRLSYTSKVSDNLLLDISGGVQFTSKMLFGTPAQTVGIGTIRGNAVFLPSPAYTLFDGRIGLTGGGGNWSLALIGRNLSKRVVPVFSNPVGLVAGGGVGIATPSMPRTIALQFTVRR
jgi:iron complex outermembrane receptor protein